SSIMYIFFFQAEDGIRDRNVTGVQTCALPISRRCSTSSTDGPRTRTVGSCAWPEGGTGGRAFLPSSRSAPIAQSVHATCPADSKSEERRGGQDRKTRVRTA